MNIKENTAVDLNRAIIFATERHVGQVRKGTDTPYIVHPLETMLILSNMHADLNVQIAGLLHDVVEDTDTSLEEIAFIFAVMAYQCSHIITEQCRNFF